MKKKLNCGSIFFMKTKNRIIENAAAFFVLAVTILIVAFAHFTVPYMLDDLWYSTNLATDGPLTGISDVVESQVWHYLNWGGRSMTHTILQLTILTGETVNNILNVIVTALLSMVILKVATEVAGVKLSVFSSVWWISAITGMLHGLNASWFMSMYWQSGSANYLYITVFIMLFAWCYIRELPGGFAGNSQEGESLEASQLKGIAIWIIPLAVLTGWSNENMGPTLWLLSVFTITYAWIKKKQVKVWMIEGAVFSLLGSVACILAPGNFVRSAEVDTDKGFLWKLALRFYSEARGGIDFLYPSMIIAFVLIIIYYPVLKNKWDLKTLVLPAMAVVAWGAMILSPHYPDRATFGSMVLFITAAVSIAIRLYRDHENLKWWLNVLFALIYLRGMFWLLEYMGQFYGVIT